MKAYSITIYGLVQGVFFRASAKEKAEALGIRGTVRNAPDGTVVIEAEGEEEFLGAFLAWCHEGPPLARVERVDAKDKKPEGFKEFRTIPARGAVE